MAQSFLERSVHKVVETPAFRLRSRAVTEANRFSLLACHGKSYDIYRVATRRQIRGHQGRAEEYSTDHRIAIILLNTR